MDTKTVKPNDFDIYNFDCLIGKALGKAERETTASSIILLSRWNNNEWLSFTWEEYQLKCVYKVTYSEKKVLDEFVQEGLLKCENGVYSVQDTFIEKLEKFIKQKNNLRMI